MSGRNTDKLDGGLPDVVSAGYAEDFYAWGLRQAALLRSGRIAEADLLHIAEEIEDLGKSDYAALESDLTIILHHVSKWDYRIEPRSRSRELSIRERRRRVARRLSGSPSLKVRLDEAIGEAFLDGRDRALAETGLTEDRIPTVCPYAWTDIMERPFTPDRE